MSISLPDARQLSDEVLQALRLRALRGCELGYTEIEVAELLGLSRETVSRWWTAYAEDDVEALPGERTGRPVGSGRTLNDGQAAWLRTILNEKTPEDVGIASPLWTRRAVADLIRKEYEIDMRVRTVGEYLGRWGYTPKVPSRHAKDQDPEEVRRWLEETYPAIEQRAAREGAEIYWCDETGEVADQQPHGATPAEGQPARIDVPDPHIRMNLISTISNEGSVHFMTLQADDDGRRCSSRSWRRLIGATTTESGLRVRADFDREFYPTKVKVTDTELATVDVHPHHFHGEWNYTIKHYN